MASRKFFIATCALSFLALLGLFAPVRTPAIASFFLAGLGFANIFPLVFAIAVESMPQHTNELSGLMVTAIVGGACLPPLMGLVADHSSVQWGFVVPLAAILYVMCTAFINLKAAGVNITSSPGSAGVSPAGFFPDWRLLHSPFSPLRAALTASLESLAQARARRPRSQQVRDTEQ